ncbi:hypothetical protein OB919_15925 [Halobacteria archaeon AArc-curdl1]|uniref:Uncharacterized protein n=1 Tax=Natronosalvus hydrolyticus TaxID=2979988 RepID=A0AAP2ZAJ1_9EURY|nr:hypothetical protein [Halobacteria archaeon AArc-curdl1]
MKRAKTRLGIIPWNQEEWEQKIVAGRGEYYWDKEYENYQVKFDKVVFPFDLKMHNSRAGLIALVRSAVHSRDSYRDKSDRFQKLPVEDLKDHVHPLPIKDQTK